MSSDKKVLKGFIKTENVILLLFVALAIGFVGGVVFSVYRSVGTMPLTADGTGASPAAAEQRAMIASLVQQTESDPTDVAAWTQLGHLYFDTGQTAQAIEAYEQSLKLDGQRPDVWTDLGVMYRRDGDPQKAVDLFEHALTLEPNHQVALYNRGIVLMHDLNDLEGALASWEKLLIVNPDARTPSGDPLENIVHQMRRDN
jgi:cytochrome c-type biogenesis protein CcmH/NrfG